MPRSQKKLQLIEKLISGLAFLGKKATIKKQVECWENEGGAIVKVQRKKIKSQKS